MVVFVDQVVFVDAYISGEWDASGEDTSSDLRGRMGRPTVSLPS